VAVAPQSAHCDEGLVAGFAEVRYLEMAIGLCPVRQLTTYQGEAPAGASPSLLSSTDGLLYSADTESRRPTSWITMRGGNCPAELTNAPHTPT
jgi:hypothetical protein